MAQGELFKSMSDKELVQEAVRAEAAEKQTRKRKRTTKKAGAKKSGKYKSAKRGAKKATSAMKPKRFYTVQVPVGAAVTITPACKTPKSNYSAKKAAKTKPKTTKTQKRKARRKKDAQ